jgi:hypothetical protein
MNWSGFPVLILLRLHFPPSKRILLTSRIPETVQRYAEKRPVPNPLMSLFLLREHRGDGDGKEDTSNRCYRKQPALLKLSFIEVKPLNVHQSIHTSILLAAWIPPKKSCEKSFRCIFI